MEETIIEDIADAGAMTCDEVEDFKVTQTSAFGE